MTEEINSLYIDKLLKNKNIPILYHFTSIATASIITQTKTLRFTKYNCLNDNHEFIHGLNHAVKIIIREILKDKFLKVCFEKYLFMLKDEVLKPRLVFFVSCFCLYRNNQFLWHRYVHNRTGSRLSLDIHQSDVGDIIGRSVIYSVIRFRREIRKILNAYAVYIRNNAHFWVHHNSYDSNMEDVIISIHRDIFLLSSFYKRRKYRNEREYRFVLWKDPSDKSIVVRDSKEHVYFGLKNSKIIEI